AFSAAHPGRCTHIPELHLKGDCLEEAGFKTRRNVTVKISDGCIVLMADSNEQLCKAEQVIKGIKDVLVYWISSVK
ncbi:TPA: SymE family type I addiction module toxin, partial [Salmonella enterica subsp. enterica serovar Kiambu]|nr:SymE family type I addiction module toxin [Salmonella enterica subsp. enterica serovar Kiambu]